MRFLSPSRRVTSQRAVLTADSKQPPSRTPSTATSSPISREATIQELRAIYRLLDQGLYEAAKSKLTRLGQNLQA